MADQPPKSFLEYDLFGLPIISPVGGRYFLWRVRGDRGNSARALLFLDLAEAIKANTPLDQALELIANKGKRDYAPLLNFFWMLFLFVVLFWYFLFILLFRAPNQSAAARRLAACLLPWVRRGLSLSEAMAKLGKAFTRQEIQIVAIAEKGGMLPQALKRLGDYRQTDQRVLLIKNFIFYPLILMCLASGIISFILIWIIPKFQDMFQQLGAELPGTTRSMVRASYLFMHYFPWLLLLLLIFFLVLGLIRSIINRVSGVPLSYYVPIFHGLVRTVREARWMAAFSLGLESGATADVALRQAGKVSGGSLEKRSNEAARLVEMGAAIGEACVRCKVLEVWINHRLQLIDWRGDYIHILRGIVADADRRVIRRLEGLGRRFETLSIIAVGSFIGLTVIALYLPLFYIPQALMAHM